MESKREPRTGSRLSPRCIAPEHPDRGAFVATYLGQAMGWYREGEKEA
jgi:hypothetical protein